MPNPVNKTSIILNGGVDERSESELGAPVAQQGASVTLKRSENTRLSIKRGTCAKSPPAAVSYNNPDVAALVPSAAGKNLLVINEKGMNQVISRDLLFDDVTVATGSGELEAFATGHDVTPLKNGQTFLPAQFESSGAFSALPHTLPLASALDPLQNIIVHAYLNEDRFPIMFATSALDGGTMTPAQIRGVAVPGTSNWVQLTWHGANEWRLWDVRLIGGAYRLRMSHVSFGPGNRLGVTSTIDLLVGNTPQPCLGVVSGAIVTGDRFAGGSSFDSTYAAYAYFTVVETGTNTLKVKRINVFTDTVDASFDMAGLPAVAPTEIASALAFAFDATDGYRLFVMAANNTPGLSRAHLSPDLATTYLSDTVATDIVPTNMAVAYCSTVSGNPGGSRAFVGMYGVRTGAGPTYSFATTVFALGFGAFTGSQTIPWVWPRSPGATMFFEGVENYAVFPMVPYYGPANTDLTGLDYVADPDQELWMWRHPGRGAPSSRYGVLRGSQAPARSIITGEFPMQPTGAVPMGLKRVMVTYQKTAGIGTGADRWAVLDYNRPFPRSVNDRDGLALSAGSLPFSWDGSTILELSSPMHFPKVYTNSGVAGTGGGFAAGDYPVAAIFESYDGSGLRHRSSPGFGTMTVAGGGVPDQVWVADPGSTLLHRSTNNLVKQRCLLYVGSLTDPVLRLAHYTVTFSGGFYKFDLSTPTTTADAQIFSDGALGAEQTPQAPSPLLDITIVGDRAWGIDAEIPSRLVYSKRRVAGVGYEWHPAYEVVLPSGAGETQAIREWRGNLVVFTDRAIYMVSGSGPDNLVGNPSGGGFSPPQKIVEVGTTAPGSVISTDVGVFFQRDEEMYIFDGGSAKYSGGIQLEADVMSAVWIQHDDEVVFFLPDRQVVYNTAYQRWTTWTVAGEDIFTVPGMQAHLLPWENTNLLVAGYRPGDVNTTGIFTIDTNLDGNTNRVWETDWTLLGGDFHDHINLHHLVYSARWKTAHGLLIQIFTEYNESAATTEYLWDEAPLTALVGANERYTLKLQAANRGTRAVKVRITEFASPDLEGYLPPGESGSLPVALTFYYSAESMLMEPAIKPGAYR